MSSNYDILMALNLDYTMKRLFYLFLNWYGEGETRGSVYRSTGSFWPDLNVLA